MFSLEYFVNFTGSTRSVAYVWIKSPVRFQKKNIKKIYRHAHTHMYAVHLSAHVNCIRKLQEFPYNCVYKINLPRVQRLCSLAHLTGVHTHTPLHTHIYSDIYLNTDIRSASTFLDSHALLIFWAQLCGSTFPLSAACLSLRLSVCPFLHPPVCVSLHPSSLSHVSVTSNCANVSVAIWMRCGCEISAKCKNWV